LARPQALKVFYVGRSYEAAALRSGKLWLGKNADAYSGYTADNHGHVVAKITVRPPETSAQTANRARVAALSVNALPPLRQAANFCSRAVLDAFSSAAITAALKKLLPRAADVYEGATIVGDVINIDYETTNGQIGNATFDLGRLVYEIIGQVPGFKLFGVVGDPAISCTEAAFWYTGELGSELGRILRKKLQPPTTVTAGIRGDWLLQRKLVSCINFPDGCRPTPLPVRFTHCTSTKCVMSRTDGVWKHSHAIVRQGRTWVAHFTDIGVSCGSRSNPANITIKLSVTTRSRRNGINTARSLGGTYYIAATRNPPNCHSNGRALELIVADQSPAAVIGGVWEGRYTCAQGLTGLDLKVSRKGSALRATFSFYPLTSNPTVPVGIYTMTGAYHSASKIVLHGHKWVLHPSGYVQVGLTGKITGKIFHGTVLGPACTTFSLAKPTGHPSRANVIGTWKGLYFGCAQGTTGLRLVINRNGANGNKLKATFNFYAVTSNPGVPSGSYAMKGYWFPGGVALAGTHWINQPPGYGFVSLVGRAPAKGAKTFKGAVPECTTFSLKRA